jgi:phosphate transport system substrate-binding protein
MKTLKSKSDSGRSRFLKSGKSCFKGMMIIMFAMCCINTSAQVSGTVITIDGNYFTNQLVERWIAEYSKLFPGQHFKLINVPGNNDKTDLKVIVHSRGPEDSDKNQYSVGRYAILPITNEKNASFDKEFRKGIKPGELKQIFLKNEGVDVFADSRQKTPPYTVYTKTPQSGLAVAISNYLGVPAEDLNGIFVSGDDKYLITSVLDDTTGVTYNNLGYIYDLSRRTVITGIKILPIDLNDNGRLDKDEQIYDNLDKVLSFLENTKDSPIPTDNVSFTTDKSSTNPEILKFINWVRNYGQEYNHQYGFLNIESSKNLTYAGN